jgi:hypothetical protein
MSIEEIIDGSLRDSNYQSRVGLLEGILLHSTFDNSLVSRLLNKTFPSEDVSVKKYRESVFLPITKTYFDKVLNTIKRVYSSDDFSFSAGSKRYEKILNEPFTHFKDFFSWLYSAGVKYMLEDANGYFLTLPYSVWLELDSYAKSGIFSAILVNDAGDSVNEVYTVFLNSKSVIYDDGFGNVVAAFGDAFLYINKHRLVIYIETGSRNKLEAIQLVDISGVKNAPSIITRSTGNYLSFNLFESFISGVCPFWTQALIEFSDKQGALKEHVNPIRWRYGYANCNSCEGSGTITFTQPDGKIITQTCSACNGSGKEPSGIYSEIVIEKDFISGETKPPYIGYVEKDLEPVKFISSDIENNIYAGLSAINMEFLMDTPLNQSGTAKEIDKSDVNHFIKLVGQYLIDNIALPIIETIFFFKGYYDAEMGLVETNEEGVVFNNPEVSIHLPRNFDYTGNNNSESMLLELINSNVNNATKKEAEIRFIRNKFLTEKSISDFLSNCIELDTLYGKTVQEKIQLYTAGAISRKELLLSINIELYVKLAVDEFGKSFYNKPIKEQLQILDNIYETREKPESIPQIS